MFDKLGVAGVVGLVLLLAGLGIVAWQNPIIAAGLALVFVGLALVLKGVVGSLLGSMGMGGML